MPISEKEIKAIIEDNYRVNDLKEFMSRYVPLLLDEVPFERENVTRIQTRSKKVLAGEFARVFSNPEYFHAFLSVLPDPVRQVLEFLVWSGGVHSIAALSADTGAEFLLPFDEDAGSFFRPSQYIDSKYMLFRYHETYSYRHFDPDKHLFAYLPDPLRKLYKEFLRPPAGYELEFLDQIEPTAFTFRDEGRIVGSLDLLLDYIEQGHLKFSKSGSKILVRSLKEVAEYCNIKEFYSTGESAAKHMRANLVAEFILDSVTPDSDDPLHRFKLLILKQLFDTTRGHARFRLRDLLFHLNGLPNLDSGYPEQTLQENEAQVRANLFDLFASLSRDQWVSMDNIHTYCICREGKFEIVDRSFAAKYLSFSVDRDEENWRYYGNSRRTVNDTLYHSVLMAPFLKGMMFLAAGLGLLDIAYDSPDKDESENSSSLSRKGKSYISVFDGMRYVKLSDLGAYIFGKTSDFEVTVETRRSSLTLDERRLLITMEGKDKLKVLALEMIADRISDTVFKVSHQSFLRECSSVGDIDRMIALFKEQISQDPPAVWQTFFQEIRDRVNPLTRVPKMALYKLKPDPELIALIAKDPVFKDHVLKVEGHHIAIESKHYRTVKNRLESYGYFIDVL